MPMFEVRFLKAVSDDTGHERKVCQRALEVEAECWAGALSAAREQLARAEGTPDWMRYADAIELERLEGTASLHPVRLGKGPIAATRGCKLTDAFASAGQVFCAYQNEIVSAWLAMP